MSSVRSKLAGLFATVLLALGAPLTLEQSRLEREGVLRYWALVSLALLSFGAAYDLYARWFILAWRLFAAPMSAVIYLHFAWRGARRSLPPYPPSATVSGRLARPTCLT
ncbi:hypothetical protein [Variovorax sp. RA8]|uniref:hypothetical protein n=1 Tax=Variovorax sp. (strain JCM 16519 / RA8) TaxID=662548 RepID=UPI001319225D|nr:hypothetical protein [Variovorax sp. RA8]VTU44607.1 hypothetical protein RA8P2_00198 [Variovorax sp. RA8]